ncbi:phage tail protein [Chitinophaga tropicalis]|uniref:Phage tail protein n=1 Tax=Chitinophaga tropicalis TaxID=2683588 RepID=A0A7K1U0R1_9BACT|nr:tail fiber protein [Chitinophaga tropicalis]MVT07876.1 phage tail protein [Chitinophaga tropicalis]
MAATDRYVAEIIIVPFNFAPKGYATCNGQLLPISQNTPLFALLGTAFGGDGKSTFGLPDLMGKVPIGAGQGPGLYLHSLGEQGGTEEVTLTTNELPSHTHNIPEQELSFPAGANNNTNNPMGNYPGTSSATPLYSATVGSGAIPVHASLQLRAAGNSAPVYNVQPSLTLKFLIAMQGVFPPRS